MFLTQQLAYAYSIGAYARCPSRNYIVLSNVMSLTLKRASRSFRAEQSTDYSDAIRKPNQFLY